jgi:solute carrier family 25 (mitochondrial carnitine/acylcarnitine transporter), member 20/29
MNEFGVGAIVGSVQVIVGHPLDTIKTNIQTNKISTMKFTIHRLYKGFKYPFFGSIIINSMMFGTNKYLYTYTHNYYVSGMLAGIITSFIINPLELYKVRTQLLLKNTLDPFKGLGSTILKESIGMYIYFGTYYKLTTEYNYNPLISGGMSGWLGWLFMYPIDVVKSRIQSDGCKTILEGFKQGNLWRGFGLCSLRAILVNSVGFYIYSIFHIP